MFKYFILFFFASVIVAGFVFRNQIQSVFDPVSVVSQVINKEALRETDGRTNFLILGVDSRSGGNNVTSKLTDTIMVVSLDKRGDKVVMVSIPRDLWVNQYRNKINSIYVLSEQRIIRETGKTRSSLTEEEANAVTEKAMGEVKAEVEKIVGIPIHYYAVAGFDIFTDSIDAVGGIDINIDQAFEDFQYPIEGRETAEPESSRYKQISFRSGLQSLNGETALEYARSRYSTNPNEAGDFARARRQQKVLEGLKDKVVSSETLLNPVKLKDLYAAFQDNVETDIAVGDVLTIYENYKDIQFNNIEKIVLSNEATTSKYKGAGTLTVPPQEERDLDYGGLYVLVPLDRTFDAIHALVRDSLFQVTQATQ